MLSTDLYKEEKKSGVLGHFPFLGNGPAWLDFPEVLLLLQLMISI